MKKQQVTALLLILVLALAACVPQVPVQEAASSDDGTMEESMDGPVTLSLWYHGAGNDVERSIVVQIIDDFNASQDDYVVEMQDFPQESYNESIVAAALADDLPDIIDMEAVCAPHPPTSIIPTDYPLLLSPLPLHPLAILFLG